MNKTSNVTTRKGQLYRAENTSKSTNGRSPVTLSEKFVDFQKTFETVNAKVAQLSNELEVTKDQLADARVEITDTKKENAALQAQIAICEQKIKTICDELLVLKMDIPTKNANTNERVDAADAGRVVFRNLPCKEVDELKLLTKAISDLDIEIYIEKRLGQIGGPDVKSCITGILNRLISKGLQAKICLTGKRTNKDGLVTFPEIMDLIHNAVRHSFPTYKDKDVDDAFLYPQFSGLEFVRATQLLDLCTLDVELASFSYSILAASAIAHTLNKSIALKVSGFEWNIIEPCFRWMQPFYDVICDSSDIFLLEKNEQVNAPSDSHHICPNMNTDDSHIIQTHNTSLDMQDKVIAFKQKYELTYEKSVRQEASPAQLAVLTCPEGLLTPPATIRKSSENTEPNITQPKILYQ